MKSKNLILAVVAVLLVGGAVFFAVSGNKKSTTTTSSQASNVNAIEANAVTIKDYMFSPAAVKVKVGTMVTWTNQDSVNHTVTADTNSTDAPESIDIAQGKTYSFTFKKAGTFTYHCFPHPYMHGTVVVTE